MASLHALQESSYRGADGALRGSWPHEQAMDAAGLEAFLDERRYCVLATSTAKGHPQARPVAFSVFHEAFWFGTVVGGRLRNLERTAWVSVVITDGEGDQHRAVAVDGPVTLHPEPPLGLLVLWEARFGSRAEWAVVWLELRPKRPYSYDARRAVRGSVA